MAESIRCLGRAGATRGVDARVLKPSYGGKCKSSSKCRMCWEPVAVDHTEEIRACSFIPYRHGNTLGGEWMHNKKWSQLIHPSLNYIITASLSKVFSRPSRNSQKSTQKKHDYTNRCSEKHRLYTVFLTIFSCNWMSLRMSQWEDINSRK